MPQTDIERARVLFSEIVQLRQQLEALSAPAGFTGRASPGPTLAELQRRLLERIEQQTRPEGPPRGSRQERQLEEVRYVIATFADEVLVHSAWYGREAWRESLLEDELFDSHEAGDRIFDNIERLLREQDPERAEVAAVYLMSLSLGFQGRYRGMGGQEHLQDLQRQLFKLAFQRSPAPELPSRRLIDQAYEHTAQERADRRLKRRWPWAAALVTVFTVTSTAGAILWLHEARSQRPTPSHPTHSMETRS